MPEGVGMDMGQVIFLAEISQPVGDAVGMHGRAIVPDKDLGRIRPAITVVLFQLLIGCLPLFQDFQRLGCNLNGTHLTGFGGVLINANIGRVLQNGVNQAFDSDQFGLTNGVHFNFGRHPFYQESF